MKKTLSASDLPTPAENVLGLEYPNEYEGGLVKYEQGHSVLTIQLNSLKDRTQNMYVTFEPVAYFQGYTGWTGANICTATIEEYISLILPTVSEDELSQIREDITKISGRLFVINAEPGNIRFTANAITLTDNL